MLFSLLFPTPVNLLMIINNVLYDAYIETNIFVLGDEYNFPSFNVVVGVNVVRSSAAFEVCCCYRSYPRSQILLVMSCV